MKTIALFSVLTAALVALGRATGFAVDAVTVFASAFAAGLVLLFVSDYRPSARRVPPAAAPVRRTRRIRPECPVYHSTYGAVIIFDTTVM